MFELDQDCQLTPSGDGIYRGLLSDRWSIGDVPNGGYMLALVMAALRQALPSPDPLAVNAHYLRPGVPGPARVIVEVIKLGRRFSTASARLVQNDKETLRVLATYGDLSSSEGPQFNDATPPRLPAPPRQPARPEPGGISIRERFNFALDPATTAFQRNERADLAEVRGWLRFADGRPQDVHALGLIVDSFPPSIFQKVDPGWVPTLELSLHVRARPRSEWLAGVFRCRVAQHGLIEEDGELWDEDGTLIAMSRQLALPPRAV